MSKQTLFIIGAALVVLAVAFVIVARVPASMTFGVAGSAVVTLVTTGAVAIERVLEVFWIAIGAVKGSWWPLVTPKEWLDGLAAALDQTMKPFYDSVQTKIADLQTANTWAQGKATEAGQDLEQLKTQLETLKQLPMDNQRAQLLLTSTQHSVDFFSQKYPDLKEVAALASIGIDSVTDFVASFKDNPGRRLISLYLGALLGLAIAGFLGLDMFRAILDNGAPALQAAAPSQLGVAITGLVMGLGANPTHEVIRVLQEFKTSQKTSNASS